MTSVGLALAISWKADAAKVAMDAAKAAAAAAPVPARAVWIWPAKPAGAAK